MSKAFDKPLGTSNEFRGRIGDYLDSGCSKLPVPVPGNTWVWVFDLRNDPDNSSVDNCIGTGRGSALKCMRFERAVNSGTPGEFSCLIDCYFLGMTARPRLSCAFSNYVPGVDDYSANRRTWRDTAHRLFSKFKCTIERAISHG